MAPVPCNDPLALATRVAAGHIGEPEVRWLRTAFTAWLRARGDLSADRCLRLPATPAQVRIARRDAALVSAAQEISASGPWALSVRLSDEMSIYATRGGWSTWGGLETPPPGCSALRIALHTALRHNDGETLSAKQLHRIVGHVFAEKCLRDSKTLTSSNHQTEP